MKVSVVMSVFNGEKFISDSVESILNQTYRDFEFVIIDDGSFDDTYKIIQAYHDNRIKLFRQSNQGVASGLNAGIRMSKGEYIARMDADDLSEPDRLEIQINYMDNHPDCVLVGVNAILIDEDGLPLRKLSYPQHRNAIYTSLQNGLSPFSDGAVMFRRSVAESCGFYNEKMLVGEDWLLWVNLFQLGEMANIPICLYRYRLSSSALTNMTPAINKQVKLLFSKILKSGEIDTGLFTKLIEYKKNANPKELKSLYYLRAGKALLEGDWKVVEAKKYFRKSIKLSPWNFTSWINFAFCFMPRNIVLTWKQFRMSR
jgi:glycosyltransferase involved in cell wall biosynthesis